MVCGDVANYIKVYTMSFLSYIPSYCTINNTTIFCSINSTDFYIILWLTVVGANSVRPLKSVIPMGFLSCLQTINYNLLHKTKYL